MPKALGCPPSPFSWWGFTQALSSRVMQNPEIEQTFPLTPVQTPRGWTLLCLLLCGPEWPCLFQGKTLTWKNMPSISAGKELNTQSLASLLVWVLGVPFLKAWNFHILVISLYLSVFCFPLINTYVSSWPKSSFRLNPNELSGQPGDYLYICIYIYSQPLDLQGIPYFFFLIKITFLKCALWYK